MTGALSLLPGTVGENRYGFSLRALKPDLKMKRARGPGCVPTSTNS